MALENPSIAFRNTFLSTYVVFLREIEPARLADALHRQLGGMPDFFGGETVVFDLSELKASLPANVDWAGLCSLLRRYQLQPIGVRGIGEEHHAAIKRQGLVILTDDHFIHKAPEPVETSQPSAPQVEVVPQGATYTPTMVVDRPLRSGQQIYAKGCDLVLLAGVSHGAEVIADGSIHCYGALHGRAIAGAQGERNARIMSTNFGPELVSIAGVFRTFERGTPEAVAGRAAQVRLSEENQKITLNLSPL